MFGQGQQLANGLSKREKKAVSWAPLLVLWQLNKCALSDQGHTFAQWVHIDSLINTTSAVALAFEEMRTPYASRRKICVQKFRNAYQRNRVTNDAFQEQFYDRVHQTIQRNKMLFANDARFPFTMLVCLP